MSKPTIFTTKLIPVDKLVSDDKVNVRLSDRYDLPTIQEQIVSAGRVLKPLAVHEEANGTYTVLQGNRRYRGVKGILANPALASNPELVASISKLQCNVYKGLTETEKYAIILDHGEELPLNREEIVLAVWRAQGNMMGESEICQHMFYQLADYTKSKEKLNTIPTDPTARAKYLKTWLHGTVGNRILVAGSMGPYVREQFLLTERDADGRMTEEDKAAWQIKFTTPTLAELKQCRVEDEKAGEWKSSEFSGPRFDAKLEEFREQGTGRKPKTDKRPSAKTLTQLADHYQSSAFQNLCRMAAGEKPDGVDLNQLDATLHRAELITKLMEAHVDSISDPAVKNLIVKLLYSTKLVEIEDALKALCPAQQ